jgi:Domain of unknown function (DUF4387)
MSTAARSVGDLAVLVRSKNAGPFWLTLDIFCGGEESYDTLAAEGVITPARIAALYRVDPASVRIFRLANLRVIKISFPRPVPQGAAGDRDMHAGQQHVPLSRLEIPT